MAEMVLYEDEDCVITDYIPPVDPMFIGDSEVWVIRFRDPSVLDMELGDEDTIEDFLEEEGEVALTPLWSDMWDDIDDDSSDEDFELPPPTVIE